MFTIFTLTSNLIHDNKIVVPDCSGVSSLCDKQSHIVRIVIQIVNMFWYSSHCP